jgi:putative DNA primase/helicase
MTQFNSKGYARQTAESLREQYADEGATNATAKPLILNPKDPLPSARVFTASYYLESNVRALHWHKGEFYAWTGTHYAELSDAKLRAQLYDFLEGAKRKTGDGLLEPFQPTAKRVNDVIDALKAVAHLEEGTAAPAWIEGAHEKPQPDEILACRNGLLHLPTKQMMATTPQFFGLNAVEFDYDCKAPPPKEWLKFLAGLWPDDPDAISCLQEMFGYFLTPDTRQQKSFLLVGPKRSGKGTIARVLKSLLGNANVAGPTLSGIGTNFGLAPLIGKTLAIISDARLSSRADQHAIAERLLTITGEDMLTIDRKHREAWTGTLPTRFLILTNELPRISDSSGALVL